jgi:hypothetical protein
MAITALMFPGRSCLTLVDGGAGGRDGQFHGGGDTGQDFPKMNKAVMNKRTGNVIFVNQKAREIARAHYEGFYQKERSCV